MKRIVSSTRNFPSVVLELGRKYPQIFPQLLSRSEGNYVIISHVGSFCGFLVRGYFTTSNNWNRFFAYFTSKNSYHPIKQGLSLFLGVKNWGYSKLSCPETKSPKSFADIGCQIEFAQGIQPHNYKLFQLADLICTLSHIFFSIFSLWL